MAVDDESARKKMISANGIHPCGQVGRVMHNVDCGPRRIWLQRLMSPVQDLFSRQVLENAAGMAESVR